MTGNPKYDKNSSEANSELFFFGGIEMVKSELDRVFKSRKGRLWLAAILAMPVIDLIIHVLNDVISYGDFESYHIKHPVFASFLSGSAIGKFPQILFFWLLPLYFLALYSDSVFDDVRYGYDICLQSRTGRREYFRTKFTVSFCLPFALVFVELLVNLLLNVLLFHRGSQFGGYEDFYQSMGAWFVFGIRHPYPYYLVYIIVTSLICGLAGVLGMCCSILLSNRYVAYFLAFFLWLIQIILPFGIGHAIQPYIEGGFSLFLSGLAAYAATVLGVFAATFLVKVKKDGLS